MMPSHPSTALQRKNSCLKNGVRFCCDSLRIGLFVSGVLIDTVTDSLQGINDATHSVLTYAVLGVSILIADMLKQSSIL